MIQNSGSKRLSLKKKGQFSTRNCQILWFFRASDAHVDHLDVSDTWGNSDPQNAAIALMNMFINHWILDDFGTIGFWLPLFSCFPMCLVIFRWPSSHFETNCHLSQWAATAPHPRPQVDANESGAGRGRSEAPEGFVWKYVIVVYSSIVNTINK